MPPQQQPVTDQDREAAKILRRMLQAQDRLDELSKTNVPQGYALIRETPDGGKIYRKPDGQLTFTSSGYATNNQAEIQRMIQGMAPGQARRAETNKQIVEQDGVRGAAASAIKGLPFIGEYFDEAVGMVTGDPRTTAALRETANAYQEQRPLETLGLQAGLGTVATLPFVPFQMAGRALQAAPTMTRAVLGGMGIGAAAGATEGAVSGFGAGEGTAQQRLPSAQTGAVIGGTLGGALGAAAAPVEAGVRSLLQLKSAPPDLLDLSKRVYAPGQPDPVGFITSAERALANPPARFRDAQKLTADQWRKFMREGGASKEAFTNQIEPALKSLGETGDITRQAFEEALARNRKTLQVNIEGVPGKFSNVNRDYSKYVAPGKSTNYRQEIIALPGLDYKSHNWNTEGAIGHVRTTDRNTATGEKVRHVEELQSDLHQEAAQLGYKNERSVADSAAIETKAKEAADRYTTWRQSQTPNVQSRTPLNVNRGDLIDSMSDPTGRELYRTAYELWKQSKGLKDKPPRAPLENWEEPFVRHALQQAAKDGMNIVTFPTHATLHKALKNEGTNAFYDERLPNTLERVAKSLGLKVERVDLNIGKPESMVAPGGRRRIQPSDPVDNPGGFDVMFKDKDTGSEWGVEQSFKFKEDAELYLAERQTNRNASVPAIRLTPEAKAELSKGVVMDAAGNASRNSKQSKPYQSGMGRPE